MAVSQIKPSCQIRACQPWSAPQPLPPTPPGPSLSRHPTTPSLPRPRTGGLKRASHLSSRKIIGICRLQYAASSLCPSGGLHRCQLPLGPALAWPGWNTKRRGILNYLCLSASLVHWSQARKGASEGGRTSRDLPSGGVGSRRSISKLSLSCHGGD
ncbi:hypothetical protein DPEC_G00350540 [Dallia pectoralis]|uniref:Uncharacterized protein n=1 Tax=Dallia pectoralis TaxID=75939 RepID=A0ACC2F243_DALPE|nr:hypothetical protein DPEC_G00350540 [Dallia pectoralis]